MVRSKIINLCKELGCCDPCCLRYLGLKNPAVYENPQLSVLKYLEESAEIEPLSEKSENSEPTELTNNGSATPETTKNGNNNSDAQTKTEVCKNDIQNYTSDRKSTESPPAKRRKSETCVSCLGVLQEQTWPESVNMVKEQLQKKRYECDTFACALSAPIATLLREKIITLRIKSICETYNPETLTALKEAWKWCYGVKLETQINKTLVSGTTAPLMITITVEYPDDIEELEILKTIAPKLFESRRQQKRRFAIEFTRRSVEQALVELTRDALENSERDWLPAPRTAVKCVSVICEHVPRFLAGRYIKLSRELPQTPWMVNGQRMMDSSVQEIIFEPIAKLHGMSKEETDARLKLMSAGREDVDVRCLGEGRPFAIEVTDPSRRLSNEELKAICEEISRTGKVLVKTMVYIDKEDLALLKKGEDTKTKQYEALCIKLTHSQDDDKTLPVQVTEKDIANINTYINTEEPGCRVVVEQQTPIRVLHRRPLLTRTRRIHELTAHKVPGQPNLFVVQVVTEAGTYVKEWAHGELGRSCPALGNALGARTDILALDVQAVNLPWPPVKDGSTQ